jgi:hypothetical protein
MRPAYVLYLISLFIGVAALMAVAYAIPRRLERKFPREFAELRDVAPNASSQERCGIVLRTGDPLLRFYLHIQQAGFYVWAVGMIAFTGALLIWD